MLDFQASLIFPIHAVAPAGPLPARAERLAVKTADGQQLAGIHIPAVSPSQDRSLILAFGGNAWNAQDVAQYLHEIFPDYDVIAFHYRGYSPSTGSPSAAALIADAPLLYDFAAGRLHPKRVIVVGFSIGSGVAAELAAQRKVDGLTLVTPFDSLKAVAQALHPWLPIGPIFAHEIGAAAALERTRVPVAIIAAQHDEIVRPERTEGLRQRVTDVVFDRTIAGAGHNDIYARSDFQQAMREALATIRRKRAPVSRSE